MWQGLEQIDKKIRLPQNQRKPNKDEIASIVSRKPNSISNPHQATELSEILGLKPRPSRTALPKI